MKRCPCRRFVAADIEEIISGVDLLQSVIRFIWFVDLSANAKPAEVLF